MKAQENLRKVHLYLDKIAVNGLVKVNVVTVMNSTNIKRLEVCDILIELEKQNILQKLKKCNYKLLVRPVKIQKTLDLDHVDDDFYFNKETGLTSTEKQEIFNVDL